MGADPALQVEPQPAADQPVQKRQHEDHDGDNEGDRQIGGKAVGIERHGVPLFSAALDFVTIIKAGAHKINAKRQSSPGRRTPQKRG